MNQELISIGLILACYLVYRVVIHSGARHTSGDRKVRK
ncbi:hypothetical protein MicloDRAFT_00011490 [Microvirga lotononidis]|uniref:Uncharacterized protein n=1 Tax=Microvirga lotononidis TaxID=864069 RepID=I4Z0T7_9HYPH|nr:hypothetical protein MicloDRAFT_00011490 [Microvirga lotononidis]